MKVGSFRLKIASALAIALIAFLSGIPSSSAQTRPMSPPQISEVEATAVASLLAKNLEVAEAARAAVPAVNNPRLWLADGFLVVFRREMRALEAGAAWKKLETTAVADLTAGAVAAFDRRTLRSLVRIASAYQFMARLGIYLNFNSILVEKDPKDVADALRYLDVSLGTLGQKLDAAWPGASAARHAVYVRNLQELASGVREDYASVVRRPDRAEMQKLHAAIAGVLTRIESLGAATPAHNRTVVSALVASDDYQLVRKGLRNVAIPDSGDIDGDDEALGRVMAVQIGFELVDHLLYNSATWIEVSR